MTTNVQIAREMRRLAAMLDPSGASLLPETPEPATPQVGAGTMWTAPQADVQPWDPRHPQYTPERAWQIMLRRYARDGGHADNNMLIKDKHARGECQAPIWPDEKQDWEP